MPGTPPPRPFLKWAGGKSQLLAELVPRARAALCGAGGYHEPFIGGGALFFELAALGALPPRVRLADTNPNLVEAWATVRDDVEGLIRRLAEHQAGHDEAHYYEVRAAVPAEPVDRAARLVYLNKTCFNGLYRENSKGQYNVPMGRYARPSILDAANLRACSAALQGAEVVRAPFAAVEAAAAEGDLVYFDPPYDPLSPTSSFTRYAREDFGAADQEALAGLFGRLAARGVRVLLSNSDTPRVRAWYAGHAVDTVWAARSVNSRADRRGKVAEVLVRGGPEPGPVR